MIRKNQLIEWKDREPKQVMRVLAVVYPMQTHIWVIDIDEHRCNWPILLPTAVVIEAIMDGHATILTDDGDPYRVLYYRRDNELSKDECQHRDRYWEAFKLYKDDSRLFVPRERNQIIKTIAKELATSKKTVRKHTRRFLKTGFSQNAFLPFTHRLGGAGKRKVHNPTRKMGPHTKKDLKGGKTKKSGIAITLVEEGYFEIGYNSQYLTKQRKTLVDTLAWIWDNFYSVGFYKNKNGTDVPLLLPLDERPTIRQFRYWVSLQDPERRKRARYGNVYVDANARGLTGRVTDYGFIPGRVVSIDSARLKIDIRSSLNRNHVIGKPRAYWIAEVCTSYILGVYLTLEEENYITIAWALTTAFSNKAKVYGRFGYATTDEEWISFIPDVLLTDRASAFTGNNATNAAENLRFTLDTAAAYRGDMKAHVEQIHHLVRQTVIQKLPGAVPQEIIRGETSSKYASRYTLNDLMYLLIKYADEHNQNTWLSNYPRDASMIENEVPLTPLAIMQWSIKNNGSLRTDTEENILLNLLPIDTATVRHNGINFRKLRYSCKSMLEHKWLFIAREDGVWDLEVMYHDHYVDVIYLRPNPKLGIHSPEPCYLMDSSDMEPYRGKSFKEVEIAFEHLAEQRRAHQEHIDQSNAELNAEISAMNKQVNRQYVENYDGTSKTRSVKDLDIHRQQERHHLRQENRPEQFEERDDVAPSHVAPVDEPEPLRASVAKKVNQIWNNKKGK